MLNINFLRTLVIVLAIAILLLISLIIYKIINGDLSSSNNQKLEQNTFSKLNIIEEFKLTIPDNGKIETIFHNEGKIFIRVQNQKEKSLIIISNQNNIDVIKIVKGDKYSFEKNIK